MSFGFLTADIDSRKLSVAGRVGRNTVNRVVTGVRIVGLKVNCAEKFTKYNTMKGLIDDKVDLLPSSP